MNFLRRTLAWSICVLWGGCAIAQSAAPVSLRGLVDQLAAHPEASLEAMERYLDSVLTNRSIRYRTQRGLGDWFVTHADVSARVGGSTIDSITIRSSADKVQFVTVNFAQSSCLSTARVQRMLGPLNPSGAMPPAAQTLDQRRGPATIVVYAEYHPGQSGLPSCVTALMVTYEPQPDLRPGLPQLASPHR